MPGRSKRIDLSTPTVRKRLREVPNAKPHWYFVAEGRYLGYRRLPRRAGTWCARFYLGEGRYAEETLGTADDDIRGDRQIQTLSFKQAQEGALTWFREQEKKLSGEDEGSDDEWTVEQSMDTYLDWYEQHRRGIEQVTYSVKAHILPTLGKLELGKLSSRQIRRWHNRLAATPARLRSKPNTEQRTRPLVSEEDRRRRKDTANRVLAILKAGLNRAYEDGRVASPEAWRRVKPFRGVEQPRIRYLEVEDARRLLNACEPNFRKIVRGALSTGARYGELATLVVEDYRPEAQAVIFRTTKRGKARTVYLTDEAAAFFDEETAGRSPHEYLFLRADGEPWGKAHQQRRIREACRIAEIDPPIHFHALRHTYASLYLMGGGSLVSLAEQLGHSDTRMTMRHYGHLADAWRAEEARKHGPTLGAKPGSITRIGGRR